jgi:hypothetical protein
MRNRKQEQTVIDELARSPVAYVQAISKIMMSVSRDKELITKLEPVMMPMIISSLEPMGVEITDECIECAIVLMYHGKEKISPLIQDLFKRLIKFIEDDEITDLGFAYVTQIFAFIQVFYQKDP